VIGHLHKVDGRIMTNRTSNDVRRKQVIDAALRIISEKGARNLTIAAIGKEVGMSEANLYRHFADKQEVLLETAARIGEGLKGNLENAFQSSGNPLELLRKIFTLHLDFVERNEGIPRLVFSDELHGGDEGLKARILSTIDSYAGKLEDIVKEGQARGLLRSDIDPRSSAFTMIGMIQVTILRWSLSGFSFSLAREGLGLWEDFEKGIVTRTE